jgi:sulfur carrier protein ThiS
MKNYLKNMLKGGGKKKMARNKNSNTGILVKVARTGSKVQEVSLKDGRTINDALKIAGINKKESEIVNVNGEEIDDLTMDLDDGDRVVLVKNIEGGR